MFTGADVAYIVGQALVLTGVVIAARWAYKAKKDSASTLIQVKNDHQSNLRDDVTQIIDTQREHSGLLEKHTGELQTLTRGRQENRADIDWLIDENTEARRRRADEQWRQPIPGGRRERRMNDAQ